MLDGHEMFVEAASSSNIATPNRSTGGTTGNQAAGDNDDILDSTLLNLESDSSRDSASSDKPASQQKRPPEDNDDSSPAGKKLRGVGNPLVSPNSVAVSHRETECETPHDDEIPPAPLQTIQLRDGSTVKLFIPEEYFLYDGVEDLFTCELCIQEEKSPATLSTSASSQINHVKSEHKGWHIRKPDAEAFKKSIKKDLANNDANDDDDDDELEVVIASDYPVVIERLEKYRREGETIEPYVPFFGPIVGDCNGDETKLDDFLRQRVIFTQLRTSLDKPEELPNLLRLCGEWMRDHHVEFLVMENNPTMRHKVLNFAGTEKDGVKCRSTFTMDCDKVVLLEETEFMICFLYHTESKFLKECIAKVKSLTARNDILIPYILQHYLWQEKRRIDEQTEIEQYCMVRSMKLLKKGLTFRDCDGAASIVARVLKVLRAAFLSYLALTKKINYREKMKLCDLLQEAHLPSSMGAIIRFQRIMSDMKEHVCIATVDLNHNVYYANNKYPREMWMRVIPTTVRLCKGVLEKLFEGESWERFLDFHEPLKIKRVSENRIHFWMDDDEGCLKSKDLRLKEGSESELHDAFCKLTMYIQLAFDAFGCGAGRMEEVKRMEINHLTFELGTCSYWLIVHKVGSATIADTQKKRKVKHTLPVEMTRVYLLLHEVVNRMEKYKGSVSVLPAIEKSPYTIGDAMQEIFELNDKPLLPEVRQVFASFTNLLFPDQDPSTRSARKEAAETFGHSEKTHKKHYNTNVLASRFHQIEQYHRELGGRSIAHNDGKFTIPQVLHGIAVTLKKEAEAVDFRSIDQRKLLLIAANEFIHFHGGVACGGGKSMAWLAVVAAAKGFCKKIGMLLVVTPYNFLNEYHAHAAKKQLSSTTARVEVVSSTESHVIGRTATMITDDDAEDRPDILFMSLTAFAALLAAHDKKPFLKKEFIHRLFIDEVHTLLSETFRNEYASMRNLARLEIPVMTLSGTLHRKLIPAVFAYFGLGTGEKDVRAVLTNDYIGLIPEGFLIDCRYVSQLEESASSIIENCLAKDPSVAIHAICASKTTARKLNTKFSSKFKTLQVDSETSVEERKQIAADWSGGKAQLFFSTTCALVGNENPKCGHVLVLGYIFELNSMIQAFNRLRPQQRLPTGSCQILLPHFSHHDEAEDDKAKWQTILDRDILKTADKKYFDRTCTKQSLSKWLSNQKECAVIQANKSYGLEFNRACKACNFCRNDPVHVQAVAARREQSVVSQTKNDAFKVLALTLKKCVICGKADCTGEGCSYCFTCGLKHKTKDCTMKGGARAVFERVRGGGQTRVIGCYSCLKVHENPCVATDKTACEHQKRIRRIIHHAFAKAVAGKEASDFNLYLGALLSNRDKYYALLATYLNYQLEKK